MKKYFPYISVAVGVLIIALYLYSTYAHNEYINKQEKLIISEQNSVSKQKEDLESILWKSASGDILYKSVVAENSNLILTEISTDSTWTLNHIVSDSGEKYANGKNIIFWNKGDEAFIERNRKDIVRLSAIY